jgi:cytochrome b pre-mRNA-processing protein 3
MLNLRKKSARKADAGRLYNALVARSRAPVFFTAFGVPDTIDGRFDLVALHGWLALAHLKAGGRDDQAQALTDAIFIGFDEALREQGTGDMGMGRKMKAFADAFFGRLAAYDSAASTDELAAAIARNLYRGGAPGAHARALAAYAATARESLRNSGGLDYGPLPLAETGIM